jgi:hypothetical protein
MNCACKYVCVYVYILYIHTCVHAMCMHAPDVPLQSVYSGHHFSDFTGDLAHLSVFKRHVADKTQSIPAMSERVCVCAYGHMVVADMTQSIPAMSVCVCARARERICAVMAHTPRTKDTHPKRTYLFKISSHSRTCVSLFIMSA